ncbi:MAG: type II toxin-antitoxin system death-on-curing family toxin [Blastocatellia bacterium]
MDQAVWLHFEVMWFWNETHIGIDRRDLIESALARPKQTAVYQDGDLIRQAASLVFGLIKNHPWRGGNKRTATHIMRNFLFINGLDLVYEPDEMVRMVVAIESDEWKVDEIDTWLRARVSHIGE